MSYLIIEFYTFWFSLLLVPIFILKHQYFSIREKILATSIFLALWLLITYILIFYFEFGAVDKVNFVKNA